jgi:hypothetical protein
MHVDQRANSTSDPTTTAAGGAMDLSTTSSSVGGSGARFGQLPSLPTVDESARWSHDDDDDDEDDSILNDMIHSAADSALIQRTADALLGTSDGAGGVNEQPMDSSYYDDDEEDDDYDDYDNDFWMPTHQQTHASVQILIGNQPLPSSMTILQAICEYASGATPISAAARVGGTAVDVDGASSTADAISATSSIWTNTHCLRCVHTYSREHIYCAAIALRRLHRSSWRTRPMSRLCRTRLIQLLSTAVGQVHRRSTSNNSVRAVQVRAPNVLC